MTVDPAKQEPPPPAGEYQVNYQDDSGYQWVAVFATEQEALDQAAMGAHVYGGVSPQQVVDSTGAVIHDQTAIIAQADTLPD
jgi:hypothetical protein